MSTLRGTTMHPRCRHIGACWDLLELFQLFSTSQNTSRIQFRTFLKKKIKSFGSHFVVLVKTFRWRINYLCRTDIDEARAIFFSAYGNSGYGQNSISNFLKNFHISWFPWCSIHEDDSIDVSITNVGLILTKLRWFQFFVKSQNSNFLEKKKIKLYSWRPFHWCINY